MLILKVERQPSPGRYGMKRFQGSLILLLLILGSACGGNADGPVGPGDVDTDPPLWTSTVGVISVILDETDALVHFGEAVDEKNPPVEYLIYADTDNFPWDVEPVVYTGDSPYVLKNLSYQHEYTIGVRCRDSATPPNVDTNTAVLNYSRDPQGWSRMWGGEGDEYNWKVDVDGAGNIYVAGAIQDTVDVDPGDGVDVRRSKGHWDCYLGSFDPGGNFRWAHTWGGPDWDWCRSVHVTESGQVCVTGEFMWTVDFDPGFEGNFFTATDSWDAFFSIFDVNGNYLLTRTWGGDGTTGPYWEEALDVVSDANGDIYVAGSVAGIIDLDPGPLTDIKLCNRLPNVSLSKFDSSGNYIWGHTFGNTGWDWATGVDVDSQSNVYLVGSFAMKSDFDPGPDDVELISNGGWDAFLISFTQNGEFRWARSWGDEYWDEALEISIDDGQDIAVVGFFEDIVDFDPGDGVAEYGSPGVRGAYLTKLDFSGNHLWTSTWDVGGGNYAYELERDAEQNIFVTGFFGMTTDFDSGPSTSWGVSVGGSDAYLLKYSEAGEFVWSRTWGGFNDDYGLGVAVANDGKIYTCGASGGPADMDPGDEIFEQFPAGKFDAWLMMVPENGYW